MTQPSQDLTLTHGFGSSHDSNVYMSQYTSQGPMPSSLPQGPVGLGQYPPQGPELSSQTQASVPGNPVLIQYALDDSARGGRGQTLKDWERLELLKICVENQTVLVTETKTSYWRQVSMRFEKQTRRRYSAQSCEKMVMQLVQSRRQYLKEHVTGNSVGEYTEITPFVDEMITVLDQVDENIRLKAQEAKERHEELEQDLQHRDEIMQHPPRRHVKSANRGAGHEVQHPAAPNLIQMRRFFRKFQEFERQLLKIRQTIGELPSLRINIVFRKR
ncbi:hypothetical protein TSTA_001580 [Talaromyces stipitatus ATCC 10500]|uniref:Uncharacterized protein n=1 Tax=Talaromyces stipitatus (strain ATCC 10500 / CBS 375.48 / QM 6759 / NRRL 1006) TaxID=441959 RepID=B8MSX2_TALSN|nr:uncharacterized protein TSTA_001580 [Talaromyces stipitatus ATCC 10500]EED12087.1 hypothetical protein TSTA_001580 [Talaromyces stipitatus ATCC 10500]